MENRRMISYFAPEVLQKMDEFEKNFLGNSFKKDTSRNEGSNGRKQMVQDDTDVFREFLESGYAEDFLNLV